MEVNAQETFTDAYFAAERASAAHVASVMERVRSLPGTWEPGDQIRVRSKPVKPLSEGHIYDVLNMEMAVPWRREKYLWVRRQERNV